MKNIEWLTGSLSLVAGVEEFIDKAFSKITNKIKKKDTPKVDRVVRWFEKDGDAIVGEARIGNPDLQKLHELFDIPEENPMYDCYPISTKTQIRYIQKNLSHEIDTLSYDYFLECDAIY
ncbi:MAG: hypothetical protein F6K14_27695 [Symploca sp. SIO2C1]|nr:hypothetical protein [Symploca sp. SIO2C1]